MAKEDKFNLTFLGAAQTVTGSMHLLEAQGRNMLVDCGMFQGRRQESNRLNRNLPKKAFQADSVFLTHAHIDHAGILPKLVRHGFTGKIHTTEPSMDLSSVMLPDSGHIQESEVERLNRRNRRRGRKEVSPIYTMDDALQTVQQFSPVEYETWVQATADIRARFWNAGHMLGSTSIEVEVSQGDGQQPLRLFFSGDIGPDHKLLQHDPDAPSGYDYLLCEATFGATDRVEASWEASDVSTSQRPAKKAFASSGVLSITTGLIFMPLALK